MLKALIVPVYLFSLTALADSSKDACALGIQPLGHNTLTFYYYQKAKTDQPYFYVKAMNEGENPAKTLEAIMATGEKLTFVENAIPPHYQIPATTNKLYIVKAKTKLTQADPLSQVMPELIEVEEHQHRVKRNVSIFVVSSLPETTIKSSKEDAVVICEHVLDDKDKQ